MPDETWKWEQWGFVPTHFWKIHQPYSNQGGGDWLHPLHNVVPTWFENVPTGLNIGVHLLFQVLRSGCQWSIGISKTENSILLAYLNAIQGAKYYIYIENQFFITSSTKSGDSLSTSPSDTMEEIKNKVGRALVDKVVEAHK